MKLFKFGKKMDVIDLGERYRKQQERAAQMHVESQETSQESSSQGALSFLGNLASG